MTEYPQYLSSDRRILSEIEALALPEQADFILRLDAAHALSCYKQSDGTSWAVRLKGDGNVNHHLGAIDFDGLKFRTRLHAFPPEESFHAAVRHLL